VQEDTLMFDVVSKERRQRRVFCDRRTQQDRHRALWPGSRTASVASRIAARPAPRAPLTDLA